MIIGGPATIVTKRIWSLGTWKRGREKLLNFAKIWFRKWMGIRENYIILKLFEFAKSNPHEYFYPNDKVTMIVTVS